MAREIGHRVRHHHDLVFEETAIDIGELGGAVQPLAGLGEGPERVMRVDPGAVEIGRPVDRDPAHDRADDAAGVELGEDVDAAARGVEPLEQALPVDGLVGMADELEERLDQDDPARAGAADQLVEMIAEAEAEDDEEGRRRDRGARQLAHPGRHERALHGIHEIDADLAHQARRGGRFHDQAHRLGHEFVDLGAGVAARVAAVDAAVADQDVDRRAVLEHHRCLRRMGGHRLGELGKPLGEGGVRARGPLVDAHAAARPRVSRAVSSMAPAITAALASPRAAIGTTEAAARSRCSNEVASPAASVA